MLEKQFEVSYYVGVSLTQLIDKLRIQATAVEPFPHDAAVGLDIIYRLNSTQWRKHRKDSVCHHIAAPSALSVGTMCDKALCQSGFLKPGQVTCATVAKFVDDVETNVLKVTIKQITERLVEDKNFFNLNFLKWYNNWCVEHHVPPKYVQFKSMLKATFKKHAKLSFDPLNTDLGSEKQ